MTRSPSRLTVEAEDYLKAIYELGRRNGTAGAARGAATSSVGDTPVGTTALAHTLGIAAASVSGMLQRLARQGLVKTARYRGTRLTPAGRTAALQLIRRHRVIESYLVTRLGYDWDDVHDEAERLEHAVSPDLIDRMARDLGNPTADPHGAPIPTADGEVDERRLGSLAALGAGDSARVLRMSDRDAGLLRYLADRGIRPGARVRVESREAFDGPIVLTVGRERQTMSPAAAAQVWVEDATHAPRGRDKRPGGAGRKPPTRS
ncbi:MAG TPA: metal-dependent transcriptional regulator [Gemmatimonadaceae bacterium]|nr:metal-dependent transcriptional regulator [Gemmatimonadaceae bacterium]